MMLYRCCCACMTCVLTLSLGASPQAVWAQSIAQNTVQTGGPSVSSIDVQCQKTGMQVQIEFSERFDGIIFSKGHFADSNCRQVMTVTVPVDTPATRWLLGYQDKIDVLSHPISMLDQIDRQSIRLDRC